MNIKGCLSTTRLRRFRSIGICVVSIAVCLAALSAPLAAQEKYLVSTDDGLLSLYDFATNSLIETVKGSLGFTAANSTISSRGVPLAGLNSRLVYDVSGAYVSVIDLTINRETNRLLRDAFYLSSPTKVAATTPDGRFLLVAFLGPLTPYSESFVLYVIDASTLKVVQKVDLSSAFQAYPGSVVALNNKAYIFPRTPSPAQKVAVVDLTTFSVSSIPMPAGNLGYRPTVVTPDGSAVVAFEDENSDNKSHLLFISTATDTLVNDIPQTQRYSTNSFTISPPGTDSSKVFAYFTYQNQSALAVDLRANSPTYGKVLPNSAVALDVDFVPSSGLAVNSDSSRLVVVGESQAPSPNVDIIDTAKMLSDPQNAIVARVTVDNGVGGAGVCTGSFSTVPPNTAPTVTGVSGDITNDVSHTIQITGGNFKAGALVSIGGMDPLAADFTNSSMLNVTVPANTPAGNAQDIIVTNPQSNDPLGQRNQSGLLAAQFNILPNPKFQPANQMATVNLDNSVSTYGLVHKTMVNVSMPGGSIAPAFNIDGAELYVAGGVGFYVDIFPVNVKNNQLSPAIQICSTSDCMSSGFVAGSRDPMTGSPVIDFVWLDYNSQMHVSVIDGDSESSSFNTVIRTFTFAANVQDISAIAISPNGKYGYVWDDGLGALNIINLSNGQLTTINSNALVVNSYQYQIGISPDGKLMALAASRRPGTSIKVFDLSNPIQPKRLTELKPVPIPGHGLPYIVNYQIVGEKLYATDLAGIVVVFNFNLQKSDFRQAGYFVYQSKDLWGGFRLSPDGAYFYTTDTINDQVLVFDASRLSYGRDALLTAIRAPYYPYAIDVSPAAPPQRATLGTSRRRVAVSR